MNTQLRIKICGITSEADAILAADLGADFIGFNFYEKSPRFVDQQKAASILASLPAQVEPVALFVNTAFPQVLQMLQPLSRIRTIQWHGNEAAPFDVPPFRIIPAFSVRDLQSIAGINVYLDICRAAGHSPSAILVDAHVPGQYGGTGQRAPWDLLAEFPPKAPLILAGGLTPENVAEAVKIVRPDGVDVASGVESTPGKKDAEKMRRFVENARAARS